MNGAHTFFCLYAPVICDHAPAQRNVEDFEFVSAVPIVTTILWGQLAGKTMTVLPHSQLLYCTAMFVLVYQTPSFPPHCGDNVKVKTQHIISPSCSEAWMKQWMQMTGALFIAYDALRMNI